MRTCGHPGRGSTTSGVLAYMHVCVQVKGENVARAHAVEVEAVAASLCSGDCFVLEDVGDARSIMLWQVCVWGGRARGHDPRTCADPYEPPAVQQDGVAYEPHLLARAGLAVGHLSSGE